MIQLIFIINLRKKYVGLLISHKHKGKNPNLQKSYREYPFYSEKYGKLKSEESDLKA